MHRCIVPIRPILLVVAFAAAAAAAAACAGSGNLGDLDGSVDATPDASTPEPCATVDVLDLHVGTWEGTYVYLDAQGATTQVHQSRIELARNCNDWTQTSTYTYEDGRSEELTSAGRLRPQDGHLIMDTAQLTSEGWESGGHIVVTWSNKDTPGSKNYELITLVNLNRRIRQVQLMDNGVVTGYLHIDESRAGEPLAGTAPQDRPGPPAADAPCVSTPELDQLLGSWTMRAWERGAAIDSLPRSVILDYTWGRDCNVWQHTGSITTTGYMDVNSHLVWDPAGRNRHWVNFWAASDTILISAVLDTLTQSLIAYELLTHPSPDRRVRSRVALFDPLRPILRLAEEDRQDAAQ